LKGIPVKQLSAWHWVNDSRWMVLASRVSGHIADEDATFVKEILGLSAEPWELSPVVVTPEFLIEHLSLGGDTGLLEQVKSAVETTGAGKDILLLEGGASLRE
jgi:hypothetical protein